MKQSINSLGNLQSNNQLESQKEKKERSNKSNCLKNNSKNVPN